MRRKPCRPKGLTAARHLLRYTSSAMFRHRIVGVPSSCHAAVKRAFGGVLRQAPSDHGFS